MNEPQADLITTSLPELNALPRKKLLPVWIKVFMWLFLVVGAIAILSLIPALFGYEFQAAIYGIETNDPLSLTGLVLISIFIFKGVTAFFMLKEKDQAIKLALADAAVGIVICVAVMIYPFISPDAGVTFSLRLELVTLIPYLIVMKKIKPAWENHIQL